MSSEFVGITEETIKSKVGEPAKVEVEFIVDTDDFSTAKVFLDKINDFVNKLNKEMEYNKIPESSRRGAKRAAEINE